MNLPLSTAASIAGYTLARCRGCAQPFEKASWYIQHGNYCVENGCRELVKDKYSALDCEVGEPEEETE